MNRPRIPVIFRTASVLVAGWLLLSPALIASPAYAVVSCASHGRTVSVTLGSGDSATISRSGSAIQVNGSNCGSATVTNTDRINATGATGNEQVTIDLSGGQFAPGATTEPTGKSEIEFQASLRTGTDTLRIRGSGKADHIVFGTTGVNLNGDDDGDVSETGVEAFRVAARGGDDTVSGQGGSGTGNAFADRSVVNGGAGADTINGGNAADALVGATGNDTIRGRAGNDHLGGGGGPDKLGGGAGGDVIRGRSGMDRLIGAAGKDHLFGGPEGDHLNSKDGVNGNDTDNGGTGTDTCRADPLDALTSCEHNP